MWFGLLSVTEDTISRYKINLKVRLRAIYWYYVALNHFLTATAWWTSSSQSSHVIAGDYICIFYDWWISDKKCPRTDVTWTCNCVLLCITVYAGSSTDGLVSNLLWFACWCSLYRMVCKDYVYKKLLSILVAFSKHDEFPFCQQSQSSWQLLTVVIDFMKRLNENLQSWSLILLSNS